MKTVVSGLYTMVGMEVTRNNESLLKHRKNCESCPTQVSCPVLSVLSVLNAPSSLTIEAPLQW